MIKVNPVVVNYQMITSYGIGTDLCWEGLLNNKTAISDISRFDTSHFNTQKAGIINDIDLKDNESLVIQMLNKLFASASYEIPADADLVLASLNGEIDFVEKEILYDEAQSQESRIDVLLEKVKTMTGAKGRGLVISAACASSSIAIARAASMIRSGQSGCVLVVACDCVSEFIIAGFSSLMALDKNSAKPFDKNRKGLSIGEAASYVLMMSPERAAKERSKISGEILGWGMSCDANHMTGPSVEGQGLVCAIEKALCSADITRNAISNISAHGTGTVYNDSMEMKAFKKVFRENRLPTYSIKGGIGHTMGAAGINDLIITLKTLEEKIIPPTVGADDIEEDARGWINKEKVGFKGNKALSTNSGFGGINSALIIEACI